MHYAQLLIGTFEAADRTTGLLQRYDSFKNIRKSVQKALLINIGEEIQTTQMKQ
jgi:hypothetical protein